MPTVEDARERMEEALEAIRREFASVRTGKASPALLDTVRAQTRLMLNFFICINILQFSRYMLTWLLQ